MLATAALTPILLFSTPFRRLLCMDSCLFVPAFGGIPSKQPFSICALNLSNWSWTFFESTFSPATSRFSQFFTNLSKFVNITDREGVDFLRSFPISPGIRKTKRNESRHCLLNGCLFYFTSDALHSMKEIKFNWNNSKHPLEE